MSTHAPERQTHEEWHIKEIRKALAEADRGEFADDAEVERSLQKWANNSKWPHR